MKKFGIALAFCLTSVLAAASDLPSKANVTKLPNTANSSQFSLLTDGSDANVALSAGVFSTDYSSGYRYIGPAFSGAASVSMPIYGKFGTQIDLVAGSLSQINTTNNNADYIRKSFDFTDHLYWRDPNIGLIGAVGQFTAFRWTADGSLNNEGDIWRIGAEGQYYMKGSSLYFRSVYEATESRFFNSDGSLTEVEWRYFTQPNVMISAGYGYQERTGGVTYTGSRFKLSAEYQPNNSSIIWFANAVDQVGTIDSDTNARDLYVVAGLKLSLSGMSLFERDRHGASLAPVRDIASSLED